MATKEATTETITRTDLGNGKYRYDSDARGEIIKSSKVLYTHTTRYNVGDDYTILFHKSAAAAFKAQGYPQYGWIKVATVEIEEAS